jgi:hypothetical protein
MHHPLSRAQNSQIHVFFEVPLINTGTPIQFQRTPLKRDNAFGTVIETRALDDDSGGN